MTQFRRGSYPVTLPADVADLAYELPGVVKRNGGLRATWDALRAINLATGASNYVRMPSLLTEAAQFPGAAVFDALQPSLREYQQSGAIWLAQRDWGMLCDPMRCLSGDSVIIVNRAGCAKRMTLRDLFMKFRASTWARSSVDTRIPCYDFEGSIISNAIEDVVETGTREAFQLVTEDLGRIVASAEHQFATPNGFARLCDLRPGDQVLRRHREARTIEGPRLNPYRVISIKNHPHARVYLVNRRDRPSEVVHHVLKHRAIYEATVMNGLSLADFCDRVRSNDFEDLDFLDPQIHIHHLDGDPTNNSPNNLAPTSRSDHSRIHAEEGAYRHVLFRAAPVQIASIKLLGDRSMFDIVMRDPYRNFVANDFVVHNSGKSRTALAAAKLRGARKILIVGPAISRRVWAREIERFLGTKSLMLFGRGADEARWFGARKYLRDGESTSLASAALDEAEITIVNYDLLISHTASDARGKILKPEHLPGWASVLADRHYDVVILDESHLCSGWGGRNAGGDNRRQVVRNMLSKAPCVWGLTGTPIRGGRVRALWGQLDLISKGLYGGDKPFAFDVRYADARHVEVVVDSARGDSRRVWKHDGKSNLAELKARLEVVALKRPRSVILPFLPKKTREARIVDKEGAAQAGLQADASAYETHAARQQARTAKLKLGPVLDAIREDLEHGAKVLVYCRLRESVELFAKSIASWIDRRDSSQLRVKATKLWVCSGSVGADSRVEMAERFCEHDGSAVWLATIGSVPGSLSLFSRKERFPTTCVHFVEPDWDPVAMLQAEDRPYEPGSTGLAIYYWAVEGTYDEHAIEVLIPKLETLDTLEGEEAGSMLGTLRKNVAAETRQEIIDRITASVRTDET